MTADPVVTTTMFTPAEQAAWEVAVQRGLPITAADLRAMLGVAGAIATGAATMETEWGVRHPGCPHGVDNFGRGDDEERSARLNAPVLNGVTVRRTVTYGPWEEVPGD